MSVKRKWLLGFLVQRSDVLPDPLHVQPLTCKQSVLIQRLEVEADERANFVKKKASKQWSGIAAVYLSPQLDQSCGVEPALHGYYYPAKSHYVLNLINRPSTASPFE